MPHRVLVSQQLSRLFSVLSHPIRIRIIAELRNGELCVNALQEILGISHSGVSQHLAILRAHKLIRENKNGRQVFYRLVNPAMACWIANAIPFIVPDDSDSEILKCAAEITLDQWMGVRRDSKRDDQSMSNNSMVAG